MGRGAPARAGAQALPQGTRKRSRIPTVDAMPTPHGARQMTRQPALARRQTGVTLVDILITAAVTAATLGSAIPGFDKVLERRHLEGASAQLETDMQLARSLAVAQNRTVRISFSSTAAGSCYMVYAGKAADCHCTAQGATQCAAGIQPLRSVAFAAGGPVQVRSNVNSIVFDPTLGTSTPTGTMRLVGNHGREVRLVVNIVGRIRACTPSPDLRGYARC